MKTTENTIKQLQFQEDTNTIWFAQFLPFSKEWMIWCEKRGSEINGTRTFKKRLSKEWKDLFNIK